MLCGLNDSVPSVTLVLNLLLRITIHRLCGYQLLMLDVGSVLALMTTECYWCVCQQTNGLDKQVDHWIHKVIGDGYYTNS